MKGDTSGRVYAGKIVPMSLLIKDHQKEKMKQEIEIHRNLDHVNIVKFIGRGEKY
jgi:serine/threonine protein kinase